MTRDDTYPTLPAGSSGFTMRHAWYAVAVLTLANVSGFVDRQILALLVEPMKRDFHVSDTQLSLLMGLSFVVFYSVLGLPIGRLVDRKRRGLIVGTGIALWSIVTCLTGIARTYGQFFAARLGVGVGEATLGPAAVSIIGDAFPRKKLGTAMGTYMIGTFFGSGVAYAIGAWVVGALDKPGFVSLPVVGNIRPWQQVFFIIGIPGLVIALLAVMMREPPRKRVAGSEAVVPMSEVVAYVRRNARTLLGLSFGYAFSSSVNYGIGAWLVSFFVRTHGWSTTKAGLLQGVLTMFVGSFGAWAGGKLTDHWAKRGHVDAPIRVGLLGAAGMIATAGLYPAVPWPLVAAALLVPVNVFAALPWGAANAAVAESLPSRMRGQGGALYQLIVNLVAGALGPTIVAVITDKVFGDPNALRWSLMICTIGGMLITIALLSYARGAFVRTVNELSVDGAA